MADLVIAIDGVAGSGKSTLAEAVAQRLGLAVLDTGAMYRAVTLAAMRGGVDLEDEAALGHLASDAVIEVADRVLLEGEDVTLAIRQADVDSAVSAVASCPGVRSALVARQRKWVQDHQGVVVEGRDIGTVVLPDADLKIYLIADPAERARRRVVQRRHGDPGSVEADLARRDEVDSSRKASPLAAAPDAKVLDTTYAPVEQLVETVVSWL